MDEVTKAAFKKLNRKLDTVIRLLHIMVGDRSPPQEKKYRLTEDYKIPKNDAG